MKQFFKFMFASMLGFLLSSIIMIVLFFIIMFAIAASIGKPEITGIKENSVLQIKLSEEITDRAPLNPLKGFNFSNFSPKQSLGLNNIIECLKNAKTDNNIKGIYLDLSYIKTGIATIEDIRNALLDFKKSGKFIVCYSESMTQGAYYIASVADKIYLYPEGVVEFKGLNANIIFLKGALEKLGVEPQIVRHGKFKSAVESLMLDKMSNENRLQTSTYLNSIFNHILKGISESRKIGLNELKDIVDNLKVQNAKDAVKYKLIDKLMYRDEFLTEINKKLGNKPNDKIEFVTLNKYIKSDGQKTTPKEEPQPKDKIAIIYAQGDIIPGEGNEDNIGSDRLSKVIRDARLNNKIKSIVFRVNSPGGSALASDIIWREVLLASKVKPVVVSMGDYAASGGYYISCAATKIVAEPNTITGSIGVFGVLLNSKKLLNEKLGITVDNVKTNKFADIAAFYRPMNNEERIIVQREVENIYDSFITKVSDGRHINKARVDSIGQGRVWSGVDALHIGLVDKIGGLNDAVKLAAELAKLKKYKIVELPKQEEPFSLLMKYLSGEAETYLIKYELGDNYRFYNDVKSVLHMSGAQARLPYYITIE
ncbi:MAG: signal peptide peptidase SppA [Bacteroidota bacterium]|nr:signal peptide peptidase SppA [Bacteroidota bacterium]